MYNNGKFEFENCKFRPPDVVVEYIKDTCGVCPPRPVTGYKCLELNIFPVNYGNCKECKNFQKKEN